MFGYVFSCKNILFLNTLASITRSFFFSMNTHCDSSTYWAISAMLDTQLTSKKRCCSAIFVVAVAEVIPKNIPVLSSPKLSGVRDHTWRVKRGLIFWSVKCSQESATAAAFRCDICASRRNRLLQTRTTPGRGERRMTKIFCDFDLNCAHQQSLRCSQTQLE